MTQPIITIKRRGNEYYATGGLHGTRGPFTLGAGRRYKAAQGAANKLIPMKGFLVASARVANVRCAEGGLWHVQLYWGRDADLAMITLPYLLISQRGQGRAFGIANQYYYDFEPTTNTEDLVITDCWAGIVRTPNPAPPGIWDQPKAVIDVRRIKKRGTFMIEFDDGCECEVARLFSRMHNGQPHIEVFMRPFPDERDAEDRAALPGERSGRPLEVQAPPRNCGREHPTPGCTCRACESAREDE